MITWIILAVVGVLVLAALAGSPRFGEHFYRGMIFGPEKVRAYRNHALQGVQPEDVRFNSGGNSLHGWFFQKPDAKFTVLFSHSNAGNVEEWGGLIDKLLSSGASVFAYDYRGFGMSEGKPSLSGIVKDGISAYDYLVNVRGISADRIVLFGSSLGTGVTSAIAREKVCAGIILHAAFSSLRALILENMPPTKWVPSIFFFRPALENANLLARNTVPLLLLHGQFDEMVSESQPEEIVQRSAATQKKLVMLPYASHMDTTSNAELVVSSMSEFLASLN